MTKKNNNNTQNTANSTRNAAETGEPNTANAVAHGGKFGSDQTLSENLTESTEDKQ